MAQIDVKVVFNGKQAVGDIKLTDQSVKQLTEDVKKLNEQQKSAPAASKQMVQGNSAMTQSLGQLGWVLGDANMFMVNFRMGMMSVANNIPMVVQGFMQARTQAADLGQTFSQSLAASIMGPGGIMIAINALMFALQVLPELFGENTEKTDEQAKSVRQLANEYNNLTRSQIDNRLTSAELELQTMDKYPGVKGYQSFGQFYVYTDAERYGDNASKAAELKKVIDALQIAKFYTGDLGEEERKLVINRKKLSDLNAENYSILVPGAKSKKEAEDKLKDWVKSSENALGKNKNNRDKDYLDELNEQKKLQDELALLNANALNKELLKVEQWYVDKRKIAKDDAKLMLELDRAYTKQRAEILSRALKDHWGSAGSINSGIQKFLENEAMSEARAGTDSLTNQIILEQELKRLKATDQERELIDFESWYDQKTQLAEGNERLQYEIKKYYSEKKAELERKDTIAGRTELVIANELKSTFEDVAHTGLTAFSSMFVVFKNANSIGQQLINTLSQMLAKMAALAAWEAFIGVIRTATFGGGGGGVGQDLTGGGGDYLTKPSFGGGTITALPMPSKISNINPVQTLNVKVSGTTVVKKGDIYVSYNSEDTLRKKKY